MENTENTEPDMAPEMYQSRRQAAESQPDPDDDPNERFLSAYTPRPSFFD